MSGDFYFILHECQLFNKKLRCTTFYVLLAVSHDSTAWKYKTNNIPVWIINFVVISRTSIFKLMPSARHMVNFYCVFATKYFITFLGSRWTTMTASWRLTANERAGEWILNHHFNDCSTKQTLLSSSCMYRFICLHCIVQVYFHETNLRDTKTRKDKTKS